MGLVERFLVYLGRKIDFCGEEKVVFLVPINLSGDVHADRQKIHCTVRDFCLLTVQWLILR